MYRFVHVEAVDDAALRGEFLSDAENGMTPFDKREKRFPELLDGMSVYESPQTAHERWDACRRIAERESQPVRVGYYVAEVELTPEHGFDIEDLDDPQGHLTIWGDPDQLAAAVSRIYTATSYEG